jgi:UDP:flavonoid glycosyltransferase YjiC (YdhE family)
LSRILMAWELGGGFGHVAELRALAVRLRELGHTCVFAVRALESAGEMLEPKLGPVVQAPVRLGPGLTPVPVQFSYSSLLHNIGFDHPVGLAARLEAWRQIMRIYRIERVVADHSPIAQIAARSLGLPCSSIGPGFYMPPLQRPLPSFQPWLNIDPQTLADNDAKVLLELNLALHRLRLPAYDSLLDIFAGCERFLLTYRELDHYEGRNGEAYAGVPEVAAGSAPEWPAGDGPRVFAYLRPHPQLETMLKVLAASRARVLLRVAEIDTGQLAAFVRPGLALLAHSVHMRQAAEQCDAYLQYAAHGTVAEMLLAGKPGVLWPDQVERTLVARRAQQLGAAVVAPMQGPFDLAGALERALTDPALRRSAETFAERYRQQDRASIIAAVAQRIAA